MNGSSFSVLADFLVCLGGEKRLKVGRVGELDLAQPTCVRSKSKGPGQGGFSTRSYKNDMFNEGLGDSPSLSGCLLRRLGSSLSFSLTASIWPETGA